ncbi:NAD(P)/FAD-dependent oxidoreductase [Halobacteriovorax sp. JY17]|uniref:phytoene desaturase family protein n=1 Tax=Halobacteriovorax sp. JY17 TaxID=2014617 RepID=UPI000C506C2E|nr:NAD(P)/FAD-dependent oxidoreductase [Halobacteriovorax sp. JY17]PIK15456.1 MAG: phytoene dehydrogenase [Halobacteriovorax sp. JY17]
MEKYDVIIIGAGMSGMAAAIRLAMYDKKVLLLEKHIITGGLNSYYKRAKRDFDVGLHALTNYMEKGEKRKPLSKLLKQLRIPYDDLKLSPQRHSKIIFPEKSLTFTNDLNDFTQEISEYFPDQVDGFNKLVNYINNFSETALDNEHILAKEVVRQYITNEELLEMIFCPLLIYGSAWENDMDFSQFAIMFKSIYMEGFSRPEGGVRTIINILLKKLEDLGQVIRFKSEVESIETNNGKVVGVKLKNGDFLQTEKVISSMGYPETLSVVSGVTPKTQPAIGKMTFCESILVLDKKPKDLGFDSTIVFYNNRPKYLYREPTELYDPSSAVICFPNNFTHDDFEEGWVRITNMANFKLWNELERPEYKAQKELVFNDACQLTKKLMPSWNGEVLFKDIFSPTTIKKYTGHFGGTVYGSTDKSRDGSTEIYGLYLCGTDQGFLGIVGSMLSGISMANLYGLMD